VNCPVWPLKIEAVAGETVMLTRTAAVTVRAAVPETSDDGSVAVMVVAPVATPLARPWEPAVLETVAVLAADDDHVTEAVRF
jgi:hypothetical protein